MAATGFQKFEMERNKYAEEVRAIERLEDDLKIVSIFKQVNEE